MEFIVFPICKNRIIFPVSNGMPKYNLIIGRPGIEFALFSIIFDINTFFNSKKRHRLFFSLPYKALLVFLAVIFTKLT